MQSRPNLARRLMKKVSTAKAMREARMNGEAFTDAESAHRAKM